MAAKRKRSVGPEPSVNDSFSATSSPRSKRIRKSKVLSDDYVVYGTTSSNSSNLFFKSQLAKDDLDESVLEDGEPEIPAPTTLGVQGAESDEEYQPDQSDLPESVVVLEKLSEDFIAQWCAGSPPAKRSRGRPPKSATKRFPTPAPKQKLIRIIKDGRTKIIQPLDKDQRQAVYDKAKGTPKKVQSASSVQKSDKSKIFYKSKSPFTKNVTPKIQLTKPDEALLAALPATVDTAIVKSPTTKALEEKKEAQKQKKPKQLQPPAKRTDGKIVKLPAKKTESKLVKSEEPKDEPPLLKVSGGDKNKDEEFVLCMNEDGQLLYVPTNVAMSSSTGSVQAQVTLPSDEKGSTQKKMKKPGTTPTTAKKKPQTTVKKPAILEKQAEKGPAEKKALPTEKKVIRIDKGKIQPGVQGVTDIFVAPDTPKKRGRPKKVQEPMKLEEKASEATPAGAATGGKEGKDEKPLIRPPIKKPTKKYVSSGKDGKKTDFVLCYNKVEDEYVYISRDLIKPKNKGQNSPKPSTSTADSAKPAVKKSIAIDSVNKTPKIISVPQKSLIKKSDSDMPKPVKRESIEDLFSQRPIKPVILPPKKVTAQYLKPPAVEKKPLVFTPHYITPKEVSQSAQGTVLLDPMNDEIITVKEKAEQRQDPVTDATAALLRIGQGVQTTEQKEEVPADDHDWINVFINNGQDAPQSHGNVVSLQSEVPAEVSAPVTYAEPAPASITEAMPTQAEVVYEAAPNLSLAYQDETQGEDPATSTQLIVSDAGGQYIIAQDGQVVTTTAGTVFEQAQTTEGQAIYEQAMQEGELSAGEVVYEQPQETQVVYEQAAEDQTQVIYEQPQEEQPAQETYEQPQEEEQQQVVYEQPQEEYEQPQQEEYEQPQEEQQVVYEEGQGEQQVIYEQPQSSEEQQIVYEQAEGEQQQIVYEQSSQEEGAQQEIMYDQDGQQVVYENGTELQSEATGAQIDYSQVAQQMEQPQSPQMDLGSISTSSEQTVPAAPAKSKSRCIIVVGDTSYVVESDSPVIRDGTIDPNVLSALMNSQQVAAPKEVKPQQKTIFTHPSASKQTPGRSLLRTNLSKQQTVVGDLGSLQGLITPSSQHLS